MYWWNWKKKFRTTRYLQEKGYYSFHNWFDDRAWYPLGRIVGGTIYPGLMATSTGINHFHLYFFVEFYGLPCILLPLFLFFLLCSRKRGIKVQEETNLIYVFIFSPSLAPPSSAFHDSHSGRLRLSGPFVFFADSASDVSAHQWTCGNFSYFKSACF